MSKKKKDVTVEQLAMITDRLTEAVDLLKIISTQTRQSEVITVRQHDDPELQRRKVSAAQEIEAIRAEEAKRRELVTQAKYCASEPVRRELDFSINVNPDTVVREIENLKSEEAERYHAYRDKPLQPYVRVHE
ncbi:hypothetical protein SEA_KILLIGREW_37 [Mycobacterium phage Killigrew]|nr:hypothetical protein SEA_KILLIGREW_37 [Mycobacterium phage Killigrew]